MSQSGLKNLYYGFLYLEKYDPNNKYMKVGNVRIIKDEDGLCEPTTWSARLRSAAQMGNDDGMKSESAAHSPKVSSSSVKTYTCHKEKAIE